MAIARASSEPSSAAPIPASASARRRALSTSVMSSNVTTATAGAPGTSTVPPATVTVRRPRGVSQSSRTFVKRSPRAARTPGASSSAIGRPSGW